MNVTTAADRLIERLVEETARADYYQLKASMALADGQPHDAWEDLGPTERAYWRRGARIALRSYLEANS